MSWQVDIDTPLNTPLHFLLSPVLRNILILFYSPHPLPHPLVVTAAAAEEEAERAALWVEIEAAAETAKVLNPRLRLKVCGWVCR